MIDLTMASSSAQGMERDREHSAGTGTTLVDVRSLRGRRRPPDERV